jgi:hypothetical protein
MTLYRNVTGHPSRIYFAVALVGMQFDTKATDGRVNVVHQYQFPKDWPDDQYY